MSRFTLTMRKLLPATMCMALATALTATPAQADYSVAAMRMDGEWETPVGKLVLKMGTFDGELVGDFFHHQYGRKYRLWWVEHHSTAPTHEKGRKIDAYLLVGNNSNTMPCRMFDPECSSGRMTLSLSEDGSTIDMISVSGATIDQLSVLKGRRLPTSPEVAKRLAPWIGEWDTTNGMLSFRAEGNMLVGSYKPPQSTMTGTVP